MISSALFARAPIADVVTANDSTSDVYSMFRIRKGYSGYCRRVRRASDSAEVDIGFTAGGYYNLKEEALWAAGSATEIVRWYNQSSGAGSGRPEYLAKASGFSAPRALLSSGAPAGTIGGYPAIEMQADSALESPGGEVLDVSGYASAVWVGKPTHGVFGVDAKLWSLTNAGDSYPFKISQSGQANDGGIALYLVARFQHPTPGVQSIIVTRNNSASPYASDAWVNGSGMSVTRLGAFSSLDIGTPRVLSAGVVHTFIAEAGDTLRALALASFNSRKWVHA